MFARNRRGDLRVLTRITVACLDMAGTTVADDGVVMAAFRAAIDQAIGDLGLTDAARDRAMRIALDTMGQSKIAVFREIFADEATAQRVNAAFEEHYAAAVAAGRIEPLPGAAKTLEQLRAAGIRVCLSTGFAPVTRDAILDALGWRDAVDLALSPADAGRGRPFPDMALTALLRLGGGAVSELAVAGDTPSDVESGLRAGAGVVAGVLTGTGTRADFERAGAPLILDSIADLVPHLTG
jgi:phosphoglycolate phosphatase